MKRFPSASMPVFHDTSVPETHTQRPWVPTLAVLLLSLAVTLVAWHNAWQNQQLRDQARLNRFVGRTEQSLRNRLGRYEDIARGAQGFFVGGQSPLAVEQNEVADRFADHALRETKGRLLIQCGNRQPRIQSLRAGGQLGVFRR